METCTTSERHPQTRVRDIADCLASVVLAGPHLSLALHHAIVHSLLGPVLVSDASVVPSRSVAHRAYMRLRISTCDCVLIADVANDHPSKSEHIRNGGNEEDAIKEEHSRNSIDINFATSSYKPVLHVHLTWIDKPERYNCSPYTAPHHGSCCDFGSCRPPLSGREEVFPRTFEAQRSSR